LINYVLFLDSLNLFKEARNILHKDEKVNPSLKEIVYVLKEDGKGRINIITDNLSWFLFYVYVANEAFQYQAKSGSVTAVEWVLEIIQAEGLQTKMTSKEVNIVLVYIGLSLYNFSRDIRYRYGVTDETLLRFYRQYDRYNVLIKKLDHYAENVSHQDVTHLRFFMNIIYIAFVRNTSTKDKHRCAKAKAMLDEQFRCSFQLPKFLIGLYRHHAATMTSKEKGDVLMKLFDAMQELEEFKDERSIFASYYYDVIYGKLA